MISHSVDCINVKSPEKNESEDAYIVNKSALVYGVLDGATPLVPFEDENGHNGAYLSAHLFKDHMERLMPIDSLIDAVEEANFQIYEKMKEYRVDVTKAEER
ncbi:hypothetical protein [Halobacillus litoralis]|uniref:hypothetical protein n=1 Tax=Halobacillus litoralis TaxID=45668 RepID=UPI001CFEC2E6|nr:hypothetical protein [Halobacillus litoralis]